MYFFFKENHARNSPPHKPDLNLWCCFSFLPKVAYEASPLRPHTGVTFCSFAITVTERTALSQPFSNERGLQQSTPVFYQEQRQHSCCLIVEFGSQVSKKSLKQMSGFLVDLERLPVQSHWFLMTLRERESGGELAYFRTGLFLGFGFKSLYDFIILFWGEMCH